MVTMISRITASKLTILYFFSTILLLTSLTFGKTIDSISPNITVINVTQKVDHFTFTSNETFNQRIVISIDHWGKDGSPIFFYTGNEGDILLFSNNTGFLWEYAEQFNAMVVFAEHRYYGTSLPFGNESFSGNNFRYLTADQALQDFASNVEWIKLTFNAPSSPVIAFGGSYGGMLAAWFRMKYPHLVEGALAGSAPVVQFPGIYDCNIFYDIVTKDYRDYSLDCVKVIQLAWPAIRRIANESNGIEFIREAFHLCPAEEKKSSLEDLIVLLTNALINMAMTDYPNPADFLAPLPAYPIRETCKYLINPSADDRTIVQQLATGLSKVYFNYSGTVECNSLIPNEMDRGWNIQSCTEMVMPICSDGTNHLFERAEFDLQQYISDCEKKFGLTPDQNYVRRTYGGKNLHSASNIIFSNGMRDPWSGGGILDNVNDAITIIKIPNACHHEDLRFKGQNDPPELLAARELEAKIIKKWIRSSTARKNII